MSNENPHEFLYLSRAQVESVGPDMFLALEVVEQALRLHAAGQDTLPHKTVLPVGEPKRGRVNIMPAYVGGELDVCGVKWIARFPHNPARYGLPSVSSLLILGDAQRGTPLAVMDCSLITTLRTAAATGIAARYLARPDSKTVGLIGAGVQGRAQLSALCAVLPEVEQIRIYDVNVEAASRLAADTTASLGVQATAVGTPEACVVGADVIVTATVADEPIVKDAWMAAGSFFAHIGSDQEEEYELVLHSDGIFVDDWPGMLHRRSQTLARMHRAGLLTDASITAELGQVITGQKPGRTSERERLYFCSVGMGTEDVALAYAVYQRARRMGIGVTLSA